MRICILNENFYRGSGITLVIQRLLTTPAFKGVDVYLAGCGTVGGEKSPHQDLRLVSDDHLRHFSLMQLGPGLLPAVYRFGYWLKQMHFDLIHAHHRRLAVLANLLTPCTGVPVLFTGHLTFKDEAWFRLLAPRIMTGVSPSVVRYLQDCTKAVEVRLIYNPVTFSDELADTATFSRHRIISVGRLDPVKSFDVLIAGWSHLKKLGIEAQLDIFGEGPCHAALEAQIADLGLRNNVNLCGFVSDLRERVSSYAFNVLVSQKEGFPNAVVEVAAHGIPTLLTDVDGSRDTLPPKLALPNGLPSRDPVALGNALAQWLRSPQLVQSDGRAFHDYLKPLCSPETVGSAT